MRKSKSNIVLIGMAGSGKSTIGQLLADKLRLDFVDTDILIEESQHRPLQEILNDLGPEGFREVEEQVLLGLCVEDHIIATGGSSVYSEEGMSHLKKSGMVVWLDVQLPVLEQRLLDVESRGLVRYPGQSFADLYAERQPLYRKYADLVFSCNRMSSEEICTRLAALLVQPLNSNRYTRQ